MNQPASPANSVAANTQPSVLDAQTAYAIASLEVRARVVAEAVLHGSHKSRRFGSSPDFAEHKVYAPGDDVRHLDWKVLGKIDRHYIKRYEDETRLPIHIVVDHSGSMAYAGGANGQFRASKWEVARTLAAALSHLALEHGDPTSVTLFADGVANQVPARATRGQKQLLFQALGQLQPKGGTQVKSALAALSARIKERALVVLISDLVDVPLADFAPLSILRKKNCDVLVMHTLDPDELTLPFDGVIRFTDLEGDRLVQVDAPLVRDAYLQALQRFLNHTERACRQADLRYARCATDLAPHLLLARALELPS